VLDSGGVEDDVDWEGAVDDAVAWEEVEGDVEGWEGVEDDVAREVGGGFLKGALFQTLTGGAGGTEYV